MKNKRIVVVVTKANKSVTKYFDSRFLCDIWCIWKNHNRTYSLIIGGKATIPIDSFKLTDNINIWIKKTI